MEKIADRKRKRRPLFTGSCSLRDLKKQDKKKKKKKKVGCYTFLFCWEARTL
jgi:hypothetical protein